MAKFVHKNKPQIIDFDYVGSSKEFLFIKFATSESGLSSMRAERRLREYGLNEVAYKKKRGILLQIISKFLNPLVIVLLIIAGISLILGEEIDAVIVSLMALLSVFLSFIQEYRAGKEAEKLRAMVRTKASVYRNGKPREIEIKKIVPGDIIELSAGDMVPADVRIIYSKDMFINQSSLTGESFPVEKIATTIKTNSKSPTDLKNIVFMGSSVISGRALGLVIKTGLYTQFGQLSTKIMRTTVETSFDKGIKNFTWLMIRFMLILVVLIFAINAIIKGNPGEALLFSLAVAVGLTPEMLPMLVTVNLSKGAISMAKKKVIIKRLNSIQNFGAMDILCTDKTGTLTLNKIVLEKHCDVMGNEDENVLRYAYINSFYQAGLKNLLDKAILKHEKILINEFKKIDEIPFDFSRRIMSVVIENGDKYTLITKGAQEDIFIRCNRYESGGVIKNIEPHLLNEFKERCDKLQGEGFRVLAVAYKDVEKKDAYSRYDEKYLILKGYVAFLDPPKPTAREAIKALKKRGIKTIVLTGDNEIVTKKICSEVGLDVKALITGDQVEKADDKTLQELVKTATVFARLNPLQKERIIGALRENKHVVGYLGDGINDAPALKASDVGISVNNAVDIAKESADIILLEKSLMILDDGIVEGRKIFGNILKYIKMGSSSNFGNMFSIVGASIFLPFLPMQPVQILLNNFLYDMSQIAIPTDKVDEEYIIKPRPWNIEYIKKFMIIIGPISSIFDYITFAVMWFIFNASTIQTQALFHTGWFIESLCTQTLVIHVIRTGKIPFIESMPSKFLVLTSILIIITGLAIPLSSLAKPFGFVQLPPTYYLFLIGIIAAYLFMVQVVKTWFIKKYGYE